MGSKEQFLSFEFQEPHPHKNRTRERNVNEEEVSFDRTHLFFSIDPVAVICVPDERLLRTVRTRSNGSTIPYVPKKKIKKNEDE